MTNFDFSEYRKHLGRVRGMDGIEIVSLCTTDPIRAGKIICSTLAKLYGPENIRRSVLNFKVPDGVYQFEEEALWTYLESKRVRKEVLEDVERRYLQNS